MSGGGKYIKNYFPYAERKVIFSNHLRADQTGLDRLFQSIQ